MSAEKRGNYFILQIFIPFSETPQTALILRVGDESSVAEIVEKALAKYADLLASRGTASSSRYAPPSTSTEDYVMRVARGDGSPDRTAQPLRTDLPIREQGLTFPYMLTLTLDPNRDVTKLNLSENYKDTLLRSAAQAPHGLGGSAELYLPPDGPSGTQATTLALASSSNIEDPAAASVQRRREVEAKRQQALDRIEASREEKERQHLADCERKELARRRRLEEEKASQEAARLRILQEKQQVQMQRELDKLLAAEQQRAAEEIASQEPKIDKEMDEHRDRFAAIESARRLRLAEEKAAAEEVERQRRALSKAETEQRLKEKLEQIIGGLHEEIDRDTQDLALSQQQEREMVAALERQVHESKVLERSRAEREAQIQRDISRRMKLEQLTADREAYFDSRDKQAADQETAVRQEVARLVQARRAGLLESATADEELLRHLRDGMLVSR